VRQGLVMASDLAKNNSKKLLGKVGIEPVLSRKMAQARDLRGFPAGIPKWHSVYSLQSTDRGGTPEPLGQEKNNRSICGLDAILKISKF
jgi:hypothetical protein